jgi:hypothetical protein
MLITGCVNDELSCAELVAWQQAALRDVLPHVTRNSPFYRQKLAHVDAASVTLANLHHGSVDSLRAIAPRLRSGQCAHYCLPGKSLSGVVAGRGEAGIGHVQTRRTLSCTNAHSRFYNVYLILAIADRMDGSCLKSLRQSISCETFTRASSEAISRGCSPPSLTTARSSFADDCEVELIGPKAIPFAGTYSVAQQSRSSQPSVIANGQGSMNARTVPRRLTIAAA